VKVGIITGSGCDAWPDLKDSRSESVATRYGQVPVTVGRVAGIEVVHVSRHGTGHARLSHQVQHRANLAALLECGVQALLSFTVCGAIDPAATPGSVVVFDDLHFPTNRFPDGSPCTWFDTPGQEGRGHWIFEGPFSQPLREAMTEAAVATGTPVMERGVYGHVDGPRFNSRSEIAALAAAGVTAVSQTAGPEVVLAGEAELPMALVGFVTDFANGVATEPEPVTALLERMATSGAVFAALVEYALPRLQIPPPAGVVHRFDG